MNLKSNSRYWNSINEDKIKKLEEQCRVLNDEKAKFTNLKPALNSSIIDFKNYNELPEGEKLVAVNFISVDQRINYSVVCKNTTNFYEIESNLYKKYPEYRENDNFFMFNGLKINRWETLKENGINGYTIIINAIDNK